MRPVIHLVDSLGLGGCQTCLKALIEHTTGARAHYVMSLRTTAPEVEINGPRVVRVRSESRFSLLPVRSLLRLARELGDPILHGYLFRSQVFSHVVKRLHPRCSVILHEGGRIVQREHEPVWERLAYRLFLRTASRSTDLFLANSHYTLGKLEAAGHRGRLPSRVIYNSILTQPPRLDLAARTRARRQFKLPDASFVIGFAGRLVERKGWREFLAGAEHFRGRRDIFWLVAGSGPEQALAERIVAEKGLGQVRIQGFQADMDSFYRALDLCLVPSHWEPHGLVQIEAQDRGVPVLVSNVPGMAETVHDGVDALLFAPKNSAELIARVDQVLNSAPLRTQLSAGSLENAKKFTIDHYHAQLEASYCLL